jgi:hypothetical protein
VIRWRSGPAAGTAAPTRAACDGASRSRSARSATAARAKVAPRAGRRGGSGPPRPLPQLQAQAGRAAGREAPRARGAGGAGPSCACRGSSRARSRRRRGPSTGRSASRREGRWPSRPSRGCPTASSPSARSSPRSGWTTSQGRPARSASSSATRSPTHWRAGRRAKPPGDWGYAPEHRQRPATGETQATRMATALGGMSHCGRRASRERWDGRARGERSARMAGCSVQVANVVRAGRPPVEEAVAQHQEEGRVGVPARRRPEVEDRLEQRRVEEYLRAVGCRRGLEGERNRPPFGLAGPRGHEAGRRVPGHRGYDSLRATARETTPGPPAKVGPGNEPTVASGGDGVERHPIGESPSRASGARHLRTRQQPTRDGAIPNGRSGVNASGRSDRFRVLRRVRPDGRDRRADRCSSSRS